MDEDFEPDPDGILRCLEALAEEAACLSLSRTFAALQDAVATCRDESRSLPRGIGPSLRAGLLH